MPPKEMLKALLTNAPLDPNEKEAMESLWDSIHRYGRLTRKQGAWVESLYFKHKLDRPKAVKPKVGAINYEGLEAPIEVTTFAQFAKACPNILPGTPQYLKIEAFFKTGGTLLRIRP